MLRRNREKSGLGPGEFIRGEERLAVIGGGVPQPIQPKTLRLPSEEGFPCQQFLLVIGTVGEGLLSSRGPMRQKADDELREDYRQRPQATGMSIRHPERS